MAWAQAQMAFQGIKSYEEPALWAQVHSKQWEQKPQIGTFET